MSIRDFIHGGGSINFKDQFVSLRLIKEALEKKFTLRIIEESTHGLKCKVTRHVRLYAAPMPFPNPALEVSFKNDEHVTVINYRIIDYDYYLVVILVFSAGLSAVGLELGEGLFEALRVGLLFSTFSLLFFGSLVLIDVRVFACRIKNALLNVGEIAITCGSTNTRREALRQPHVSFKGVSMNRIAIILFLLASFYCTSCVGLVVLSGERVDYDERENCDNYHYCQKEPDKIKASFRGEPDRKYVKDNKEYWIYENKSRRGILLGAIIPLPLYFPWTTDTIFTFENGKRIHTSTMKNTSSGFLCGYLIGIEEGGWDCWSAKYMGL